MRKSSTFRREACFIPFQIVFLAFRRNINTFLTLYQLSKAHHLKKVKEMLKHFIKIYV